MDENKAQEEIHSKVVRAGKRTYFFDVRATRADDYYLTITESKNSMMMEALITKSIKYFYTKKILQNSTMLL